MVQVINIKPEYEAILGFLYPTYSITASQAVVSKFIVHRQVRSKQERETLDIYYSDGIFISTQIFDELWDEQKIKEECVKFAQKTFKSRKKVFNPSEENFVQDCVNFIVGIPSEEEQTDIIELFDSLGTKSFPIKWFNLLNKTAPQQLLAAITTFTSKCNADSTSVYYRKKYALHGKKIKANLVHALDSYLARRMSSSGCSECKLIMDIYDK